MVSIDGIFIYSLVEVTDPIIEPFTISYDYDDLILDSGTYVESETSTSGKILIHKPEDSNYRFWHSPYVALPKGIFEIHFKVKCDEVFEGHLLTFDITSDSGGTLLAKKYVYNHDIIPNMWNDIKLEFSINEPMAYIAFQGSYASNATTYYFDFMMLKQLFLDADITFGSISYNHNDFAVLHGETTNGVVMHKKSNSSSLFFGMYTSLQPGEYQVDVWLRLDEACQGQILSLEVEDFNGTDLAETLISSEDFNQPRLWQHFSFTFKVYSFNHIVEIKGMCTEGTAISLSYFEIIKVDI
jgi:hypothetical protein